MPAFLLRGPEENAEIKTQNTSRNKAKKRTQDRVAKLKELYSSFGFESLHEDADAR